MTRAGPLLLTTGIEDHRPLGALGEPVYLSHRKIAAAVTSRLGPDFAHYLARPEVDSANRRINWHAEVEGEVRRWTELSAQEQAALTPKIERLRDGFAGFVADLEKKGGTSRAEESFGRIMHQAIRSPGISSLFFVGEEPVLTLWGFEGEEGGFDTLAFAYKPSQAVPASPVTPPPIEAGDPAVGRPWWRWLIWLLALLLLLLLLFFLLRGCEAPFLPETLREEPVLEPSAPLEEAPHRPGAIIETPPGVTDGTTGAVPDAVPGEPSAPAAESPTPESQTLPAAEEPAAQEPPAEEPPAAEPAAPEPPASEPPTAGPPAPEPLSIPQDGTAPNAVDFMRGQWRSDSGLVDKITGKPLEQTYDFDEKGEGQVVIRREDGTECRGPARVARTEDGGLRIQESGQVTCADGSRYSPSVTECKPSSDGRALCQGVNPDGSGYKVEITR